MNQETIIREADLHPVTVSFGEITYPTGGTLGPRKQPNLQLVIVHSGQMSVDVDGRLFLVGANQVLLLLPGQIERFAFAKARETTHSWVHASIQPLPGLVRDYMANLPRPIMLSPILRNLMSEALRMRYSRMPSNEAISKAIATYMFRQYLGEAELHLAEREKKSASHILEKARDFMHLHLGNHLSVEAIAQAVGISRSQLTRIFKAELQVTPMTYLWQLRVQLGIDMLRNTGLPVGTIATHCGFKNRYHFSRSVRNTTQMSPRQLRQNWWRGDDQ